MQLFGGGIPVPAAPPATLGSPSVKLEALNELIHFDHIYTKPVEEVSSGLSSDSESDVEEKTTDETTFPITEVVVDAETVCIKDEPQEVVITSTNSQGQVDEFISGASSPAFGGLDKEACMLDTYSDSGYERSPSPFSNMSSPLCSGSSWDDMFANELFPQLISV